MSWLFKKLDELILTELIKVVFSIFEEFLLDNDSSIKLFKLFLSIILSIFHLAIFGNDNNDEHPLKILSTVSKLFKSHFDILGNDCNDEHFQNNPLILVTLFVFHFDISGNDCNDEH